MSQSPDQHPETSDRLLQAAISLFSQHGYDAVTTRDLGEAAGANIAAINYYFGSKEGLYRRALLTCHAQSTAGILAMLDDTSKDAESRLREYVRRMVSKMVDPANANVRLLAREQSSPTAALDEVVELSIRPICKRVESLIQEIAGPDMPALRVSHARSSLVGQCLMWFYNRPVIERLNPNERFDAEEIAVHICDLTIGGLLYLKARHST